MAVWGVPPAISISLPPLSTVLGYSAATHYGLRSPVATRVAEIAQGFLVKPTVLVTEKLEETGLDLLRGSANVECAYNLSQEELCTKISLCDALIVRSETKVGREVFESSGGRLRVVGRAGVGIDNVDHSAASEYGCIVVNAPNANIVASAEHAIALLAAMARNVAQANAALKAGKWERDKFVGVSLVGKTLAVMGFGNIGMEVARRAKGLGMLVIAHDPYASSDLACAMGITTVTFEEAIASADFISFHMPLTPSTSKLFNDDTFKRMKKGVRIINVARGGVIDEKALLRAIDTGIVAQDEVSVEIAEAVVGALKGELSSTAVNAPLVPAEVTK